MKELVMRFITRFTANKKRSLLFAGAAGVLALLGILRSLGFLGGAGGAFPLSRPAAAPAGVLELYARAAGAYSEGRFSEVPGLLAGAGAFPPALILRGKAEFFSGETQRAEELFRRALRKQPASAEASLYLARILREQGKAAEAGALVEGLIGDDPSDLRALRLAAELERDRGAGGEGAALALLDRAAEASSEAALVFLDRARLRWIAGKGPEALEDLQRVRALLPPGSPLQRGLINLESTIRGSLER
jgi:tetratricopeptide (TPR) repeat protein